jgi:thiol:disulfide interchange protein
LNSGADFAKALMAGRRGLRKPNGDGKATQMLYRAIVAFILQVALRIAAAFLALLALPAQAAPTNISASLVVERAGAPGETIDLAIVMKPAPGWHGYWSNPGDAGLGMQLDWKVPYGTVPGKPLYPVPQTLLIQGLMNHVYASEYVVIVPLKISRDAAAGKAMPISVDAQWLACTDKICVPERASLAATVNVAPGGASARDVRFDLWRQHLPPPLDAPAKFTLDARQLRMAIPLPASVALRGPHLFIGDDKVVEYAGTQRFSRVGDTLVVEIPRAKFAPASPTALTGVLRLASGQGDGLTIAAEPDAVPPAGTPLETESGSGSGLAMLLLAALAGGLLLNIMPCVFPILSLKALSLARAGESEADARREGLAYTAGVMTACVALGALLLTLRGAGQQVGWAFQLQEPGVVAVLLVLATALTANFRGAFEFAVPGFVRAGSAQGAFATGLLAAFVATPCTGPFMAAAMGAALLLPAAQGLALFAALGLGIALPFLAIAFVPGLRARLPRPGAWMTSFRHWMALPMGLTALALLWLCWRLGGAPFAALWLAIAAAIAALLVITGKRQRRGLAASKPALLMLAALTAAGLALTPFMQRAPAPAAQGILGAKPFSESALAQARASGKPVFLYFTADWCLTCKVNERVAIEREDVRDAFAKAGVTVLVGDWTRRDPAITRFLTAQGAAGVPLYLWYPAGPGANEQLPQILTPAALIDRAAK